MTNIQTYTINLARALDANDREAADKILDECWQNVQDMEERKKLILEVDKLDKKGVGLDIVLKLNEQDELVGFDFTP